VIKLTVNYITIPPPLQKLSVAHLSPRQIGIDASVNSIALRG